MPNEDEIEELVQGEPQAPPPVEGAASFAVTVPQWVWDHFYNQPGYPPRTQA